MPATKTFNAVVMLRFMSICASYELKSRLMLRVVVLEIVVKTIFRHPLMELLRDSIYGIDVVEAAKRATTPETGFHCILL